MLHSVNYSAKIGAVSYQKFSVLETGSVSHKARRGFPKKKPQKTMKNCAQNFFFKISPNLEVSLKEEAIFSNTD